MKARGKEREQGRTVEKFLFLLEVVSYTQGGLEFKSELGVSPLLLPFCFEFELQE